MDQLKIGEFISSKRKELGITQLELAEKLNITDRAVSKWENGICMPDAGTIPDLCKILKISINDLFSGKVVDMKDLEKQTEENLLSLKKNEEEINKKLFFAENVIGFCSTIFFLAYCILLLFVSQDNFKLGLLCIPAILMYLFCMFAALRLDAVAGYQECKHCHHKFKPSFKEVFLAMHIGYTRYLKCPKCGKKSWCKKVMK